MLKKEYRPTPEHRKKISEGLKKRWQNPEYRKKISEAKKGGKNPMKRPEVRKKISKSKKGKCFSEEHRKKLSESAKKRWQNMDYREREKMRKRRSEAMKGDKNPMRRPEVAKKVSEKLKKIFQNPEIRKKRSERVGGNKNPSKRPEVREKIKQTLKGKLVGEKNPNYKGGKSFEVYPEQFWQLRKAIRERDSYTCQVCGEYPAFDVHHIDYNKKNNEPENLITLCRNCHSKTNGNREYWKGLLQNLMKNKKGSIITPESK
jgi:5-methylcytosine-specific restriction endonuclease McrA